MPSVVRWRNRLNGSAWTERSGALTTLTAAALVAALVVAGGGLYWYLGSDNTVEDTNILLHTVARDNFELSITERGEIEAFDVTEVRSLVKSKNTSGIAILRIVPEGTAVKKGDFLVELDSSALEADRTSQKILVNDAKAAEVEAHNNYDVAVIAKREYLEGTYLQDRQTAESEQFVSEENLNRAKEYYAYSQKLASKGYVNENQLEADRFAVEKAKKDLDASKSKLRVLEEFTKPKQVSTLESAILIAKAKWEAALNSHQLEVEKLQDIEDQIAKCTITAPQDGVVKYAHVGDFRDQQFIVEEGAVVRERQVIIKLPNADSMRVNLTVNESLVQYVQPGYTADIRPVGYGDRVLHGIVEKVNQYAEPTGWRQANVKEYKAFIRIDDALPDLRSGMTASVTIHCADVPDAIQVPVQAIYAHGPKFYCFIYNSGKWEPREVKPGPTNDKFFVVEDGLKVGEQVALNPRSYIDIVSLPKLPPEEIQRAVPQPGSGQRTARRGRPAETTAVAGNENGKATRNATESTPGTRAVVNAQEEHPPKSAGTGNDAKSDHKPSSGLPKEARPKVGARASADPKRSAAVAKTSSGAAE